MIHDPDTVGCYVSFSSAHPRTQRPARLRGRGVREWRGRRNETAKLIPLSAPFARAHSLNCPRW
eukprot:6198456-Pleurochrysis_carterae.AAC.2